VAAPTPNPTPTFVGGEHAVFEVEDKTAVLKHTVPGFYGRTMDELSLFDQRTFLNCRRLTLRGALPSEYLRRWAVLTDIFGLPTTYQGCIGTPSTELQMAVAQPYIEQADDDPATLEDAAQFMQAHGFMKVDPSCIAIPEIRDVTWYRQRDGILITDAHARNFRKASPSGVIVPIDLVVTTLPKGVSKVLPEPDAEWQPSDW
jgi:hypothetical protein